MKPAYFLNFPRRQTAAAPERPSPSGPLPDFSP